MLNNEEKPFRRIAKRLMTSNNLVLSPTDLSSPSESKGANSTTSLGDEEQSQVEIYRQLREDITLDCEAFESSIVRTQFLLGSNERERERYAAEKIRIQATAQAVRDNTAELRVHLEEAQNQLALRKTYDELAEKITSNRLLRPREDQYANLDKLNNEIADLEKESKDYAHTWAERREQFGKIIEEGMHLRRLIRDEKEEVERREGMEEREDGDEVEGGSSRERPSAVNTPRGGATPLHPGLDGDSTTLGVDTLLQPRARSPLRMTTPGPEAATPIAEPIETVEVSEDIDMAEDGEVSGDEGDITSPPRSMLGDDDDLRGRAGSHMEIS